MLSLPQEVLPAEKGPGILFMNSEPADLAKNLIFGRPEEIVTIFHVRAFLRICSVFQYPRIERKNQDVTKREKLGGMKGEQAILKESTLPGLPSKGVKVVSCCCDGKYEGDKRIKGQAGNNDRHLGQFEQSDKNVEHEDFRHTPRGKYIGSGEKPVRCPVKTGGSASTTKEREGYLSRREEERSGR